jgi:hypothetical protein
MKTKLSLLIALAIGAGSAFAQENYSQWTQHKSLYINTSGSGANTAATVTKFPLLVRLDASNFNTGFAQAKGKGIDIRFTKAGDAVRLPHQIERWDSAGKKAEIWVLVDSVKGATRNQFIRMHWGKADAADSSRGAKVFDSANGFVGVWHLGDSTNANPRPNAAGVAPSAILRNFDPSYTPKAGVIGFADSLRGGQDTAREGGKDYLDLNHRNSTAFNDFTTGLFFSTWINVTESKPFERFLEWSDDTASTGSSAARLIFFGNHSTAAQTLSVRWGSLGTPYNNEIGGFYAAGEWAHVALSKPAGNSPFSLYANGKLIGTTESADDAPVTLRNYVAMGRSTVTIGDQYYTGKFDEAVLARAPRSADWVALSYASQRTGANILTDSVVPATRPGAPASVTVTAPANSKSIVVTWTAPASNGGEAITGYTARAVSDTAKKCTTTGATTFTCTITGLTENVTYRIAVRATNSVGTSDSTLSAEVKVPVGLIAFSGARGLNARFGSRELLFDLPAEMAASVRQISVSLVAPTGRTQFRNTVAAVPGLNRVSWNAQNLASGLYIARITLLGANGKTLETLERKLSLTE